MKNVVWIFPYLISGYCFGAATVLSLTRSENAGYWPWFVVAGAVTLVSGIIAFFVLHETPANIANNSQSERA